MKTIDVTGLTPEQEQTVRAKIAELRGEPVQYFHPGGVWIDCDTVRGNYPHRPAPGPDPHAAGKGIQFRQKDPALGDWIAALGQLIKAAQLAASCEIYMGESSRLILHRALEKLNTAFAADK